MKWVKLGQDVFEAQSKLSGHSYILTKIRCGWVVNNYAGCMIKPSVCVCKYKKAAIRVCEAIEKWRIL